MIIRRYTPADIDEIAELFYNSVHSLAVNDYTPEQLDAWADGSCDLVKWNDNFCRLYTLVANENGIITGFANMDENGYLDMLYVHKDYAKNGIATALCAAIESKIHSPKYTVYASKTAKGFFEKMGYTAVRENTVIRHNVKINNYFMVKESV